jgi:putative tryptophan/tyrosine transport system substrate-binding protein
MQFDRLKRREFITLLGGESLAWPLAAPAQQPTMTVIGFLHSASPEPNADRVRAFRQALKDTGYVEGENVAILYRWAEGRYDRLPELAAELVRRQVAVIAARLGLVASLSRPGGNATGVNFFVTELGSKQLGLLHELIPAAARVGLLVNPNYPTMKRTMRDVTVTASAIGLQVDVFQASDSREIESVFGTLVRNRADALLVGPDAWEPGFSAGIRFSTQAIKTGKCAKRNWQTVRQCAPQKSRAAKVR